MIVFQIFQQLLFAPLVIFLSMPDFYFDNALKLSISAAVNILLSVSFSEIRRLYSFISKILLEMLTIPFSSFRKPNIFPIWMRWFSAS